MATATLTFNLTKDNYDGIIIMGWRGVNYWASYMESTAKGCHFTEEETEKEFFVTREMLEQAALDLHVLSPLNNECQSAIRQLVVRGCGGSVDSDIADVLIQQACFGQVIYG